MINIIFNLKSTSATNENDLISINQDYVFRNNDCAFGSLSKTNIFIGENNSGKSRFLRHLFANEFYSISKGDFAKFYVAIKGEYLLDPFKSYSSCLDLLNDFYQKIGKEKSRYSNVDNNFIAHLKNHSAIFDGDNKYYFPVLRGFKDYKKIINTKLDNFLRETRSIQSKDSINHYISLLNLEAKGLDDFDIYREVIISEYFKKNQAPTENILTGGKLYQEIKSMLLGKEEQRKLIDEFQEFLYDNFFSEYGKVQLIPNEQEKLLYVKIGNDERPIYDWGDGTQQLIIILFSLFIHKDEENKLFFIEEPEMYLHPGILRKFIEVINSETFKSHQYFITTHSNIILDTSADSNIEMSIFKFKKFKKKTNPEPPQFSIEQCNNGDVSLLNELGIRNSSVFLSNCSVWVEGITDRLYLKHFLELYLKKHPEKTRFRENIDFTFIEYGGGNLVHFNFEKKNVADSINARYINNKIFLIADNDGLKASSKKGQRKARLKEVLGDNFYELSVLEIENLISQNILKAVLIQQNPKKEVLIEQKFAKEKNFTDKKLGKYLDELFKGELCQYADDSGTIKNKLEFCKAVIAVTEAYDDLSIEAKILTEKIYSFISKNN